MDYYMGAKNFILKNARPLDMARWNYLFENGNKKDVIKALEAYQNTDGGFATALEPDCPLQQTMITLMHLGGPIHKLMNQAIILQQV